MENKQLRNASSLIVLAVSSLLAVMPSAMAAEDWDFIGDARLRYETVDQDGFANKAHALTLRIRAGVVTPTWNGFELLVEGEGILAIANSYNSTANGKVGYPIVADPGGIELNRAQITYTGIEGTTVTLGRQRITLSNQRFVGNVGFRQNEQTFDALRIETKVTGATLSYVYIDSVQRVFGNESPIGAFESDSHLFSAEIGVGKIGNLSPYVFLLDLEESPTQSTATYGLRWTGAWGIGEETRLSLAAEYAHQSEYGDNPFNVDLGYGAFEAELKQGGYAVVGGVEWLDGDGTVGFSTPLATLYKFNGNADAFLTTPARGLTDFYIGASAKFAKIGENIDLTGSVTFHDFSDSERDREYGQEWDFMAGLKWENGLSLEARAAFYERDNFGPASRDKFWLAIAYPI